MNHIATSRLRLTLRQMMAMIALIAVVAACWVNWLVSLFLLIGVHVLFPVHLFWRFFAAIDNATQPNDRAERLAIATGLCSLVGWVIASIYFAQPVWLSGTANLYFGMVVWSEIAAVGTLTFLWALAMIRKHL